MSMTKEAFFAAVLQEALNSKKEKPLPNTEKAALLEATLERIDRGNPFSFGEWVTPRADSTIKGRGEPHLVVGARILHQPEDNDLVLLWVDDYHIVQIGVFHSWEFEHWTDVSAKPEEAAPEPSSRAEEPA